MTCEDIVPSTTLGVGVGATVTIATGGFDWITLLLSVDLVGGVVPISVIPDGGPAAGVVIDSLTLGIGGRGSYTFGGSGGEGKALATAVKGAVPYVPNQVAFTLPAVATASWTYVAIGGYLE